MSVTLPNFTAERHDEVVIGDTWYRVWQFTDGEGTGYDFTNATGLGEVYNDSGTLATISVGAVGHASYPITAGWLALSMASTVTDDLTQQRARYRVRLTWSSPAWAITILEGDLEIQAVW
jgi:hypothetical protein